MRLGFRGGAHDDRVPTGGHALSADRTDKNIGFGRLVPRLPAFFLGVGALADLGRRGLSGGGCGGDGGHVGCWSCCC